jgi:hypothetical protein
MLGNWPRGKFFCFIFVRKGLKIRRAYITVDDFIILIGIGMNVASGQISFCPSIFTEYKGRNIKYGNGQIVLRGHGKEKMKK